jgi:glycosyltransferase involved in cell wall biosynthesis
MSQTIIIIPCYNEESRLDAHAFKTFTLENHHVRFLFVNDGSTDRTLEVLEELCRSDRERFEICDLTTNLGKAEAVRRGLLRAQAAEPDYLGYWDADLATPLDAILAFCSLMDSRPDIEMVFGARVSLLGRSVERRFLRHYLGRVFATAASLALGIGLYDTQCGAKLFRVSQEILSLFQSPFSTRWLFDVEIIARLASTRRWRNQTPVGEVVYEFPLQEWRDVAGSKVKPYDFMKAFVELAEIAWSYRIMNRKPTQSRPWPWAGCLERAMHFSIRLLPGSVLRRRVNASPRAFP